MSKFTLQKEQIEYLAGKYGTPLYLYDETILRTRCSEMRQLLTRTNFRPQYSAKANTNIELLKIIRSEGLCVDAMSPGEILLELEAGFTPEEILFVANNVDVSEMAFALERGITVSVDSLAQLETFGKAFPGRRVAVRLNPGIGDGHNEKVITGGKSKFGIELSEITTVKEIAHRYDLHIIGLNHHIGSLFLEGSIYIKACETLLKAAEGFDQLEFVDLGGGFGVPYQNENRLDLASLSSQLNQMIDQFVEAYPNKSIEIKTEPGRYVVAECGLLIGRVNAVKVNYNEKYIGTDIGFNVLMRPILYDSYHNIIVYNDSGEQELVTVVGNICETGDILAKERMLPCMSEGDYIGIETAGAYGYAMCSNYNARLRPAEVLLQSDGQDRLIRRRDTYEDILKQLRD